MKESLQQKHIVIGGGIAGILTAIILAKKGNSVVLIESTNSCGGLLKSHYNEDGIAFDMGAHILKETGITELDQLLYGDFDSKEWQTLDRLKVGGYFAGKLYSKSQFPNLRDLPEDLRNASVYDLLSTNTAGTRHKEDALSYANQTYGRTVTEKILQPIIEKRYGIPLEQLNQSAITLLGYNRFIAFDQDTTSELKQSKLYDQKLGHTTWDEGTNPLKNFYPTQKGIQIWIDGLINKLKGLNAEVLTNTRVESIETESDKISSVILNDNTRILSEKVFWTASPALLLSLAKKTPGESLRPTKFRSTALLHLVFDKPFNTDLYYYYNHDPTGNSYRTTFYSNLREINRGNPPFNCTIEVISDEETVRSENLSDELMSEMCLHGIITPNHKITYQKLVTSKTGFPLPTTDYIEKAQMLAVKCSEQFENVELFGRAGGQQHFMNEIIAQVWEKLHSS